MCNDVFSVSFNNSTTCTHTHTQHTHTHTHRPPPTAGVWQHVSFELLTMLIFYLFQRLVHRLVSELPCKEYLLLLCTVSNLFQLLTSALSLPFCSRLLIRPPPLVACRQCPGHITQPTPSSSSSSSAPSFTCPPSGNHILCQCCLQCMPDRRSETDLAIPTQKCNIQQALNLLVLYPSVPCLQVTYAVNSTVTCTGAAGRLAVKVA